MRLNLLLKKKERHTMSVAQLQNILNYISKNIQLNETSNQSMKRK